jgi:hypothetical protein
MASGVSFGKVKPYFALLISGYLSDFFWICLAISFLLKCLLPGFRDTEGFYSHLSAFMDTPSFNLYSYDTNMTCFILQMRKLKSKKIN